MPTKNDVLIVSLSDMHSGSERALFPNWEVVPEKRAGDSDPAPMKGSAIQHRIFKHFDYCAGEVKKISGGKRLVVVNNGDAVEGAHHGTIQIMSPHPADQVKIHIELMEYFLDKCGFSKKRGDELHYVSGTETHTGWTESGIVNHFSHLSPGYHDDFRTCINGREVWHTHHGGNAGDGQNEGDAYRNWLKRIYYNNLKGGKKQPDIVFTGHVHRPIYASYVQDYHTIHGIIIPSWQLKTRYAYRAAPFQRNLIGMTITEITAGGDIRIKRPLLMEI